MKVETDPPRTLHIKTSLKKEPEIYSGGKKTKTALIARLSTSFT